MAIVVDEPIINSPFAEPTRHHRAHGNEDPLRDGRRPSGYTPGLRTRGGQTNVLEDDYVELPIVNEFAATLRAGARRATRGRRARRSISCATGHGPSGIGASFSASWRRPRRPSGWWRDRCRTGR